MFGLKARSYFYVENQIPFGFRLKISSKRSLRMTHDIILINKIKRAKERLVPQEERFSEKRRLKKLDESKTWRKINWRQEDKAD